MHLLARTPVVRVARVTPRGVHTTQHNARAAVALSHVDSCRIPGTNKLTWGQSRTLLPVGHPGRVKPDGSVERRGPPIHRTNERMQELARECEALLAQGDARAAADHYREHGQQTCPFHRLPYAWLAVTDGMHAVTSPHTHTGCVCRWQTSWKRLCWCARARPCPRMRLEGDVHALPLRRPLCSQVRSHFLVMTIASPVMCAGESGSAEGVGSSDEAKSGEAITERECLGVCVCGGGLSLSHWEVETMKVRRKLPNSWWVGTLADH